MFGRCIYSHILISRSKSASIWGLITNSPALASTNIYVYYGNILVCTTRDPCQRWHRSVSKAS